jgi:hypothetical protein
VAILILTFKIIDYKRHQGLFVCFCKKRKKLNRPSQPSAPPKEKYEYRNPSTWTDELAHEHAHLGHLLGQVAVLVANRKFARRSEPCFIS